MSLFTWVKKRSALQLRTHSVFPAEVVNGAHIRALHLFESSFILDQQSGAGSSIPETGKSSKLITTYFQSHRFVYDM